MTGLRKSPGSAVEVERTFEFSPAGPVPDLLGLVGIAEVQVLPVEHLDATYYDTADLRLVRLRTTLRRRRGGRDAGWHLKLPLGGDAREEVTLPLGRSTVVPGELRALVLSRTRAAALAPVVRLRTERTVRLLLDAGGSVLAELADDQVVGTTLGADRRRVAWRELEVELVAGDTALLDRLGRHLVGAGARTSARPSKLARTLEGLLPAAGPPLPRRPTAVDAVGRHLREQYVELVSRDPGVRRDAPDAVHKMRVATRRLRSALATYRPLLERAEVAPLGAELKHLAAVLGQARDAEVLREHLLGEIGLLPAGLVPATTAAAIAGQLQDAYRAAHDRVLEELDGPRYTALLEALDHLVEQPPWTAAAQRPAAGQLRRQVRRSVARLDRVAATAEAAPTAGQRDELLHEVRKAAKQVRYATESTAPVLGKDAVRFARRVQRVQEALGDHQDSVVIRERIGALASDAGDGGFVLGVLYGLEQVRAEQTEHTYVQAWQGFSATSTRRWLRR